MTSQAGAALLRLAAFGVAAVLVGVVLAVFAAAEPLSVADIPADTAWAGFCTGLDDRMDDSLLALRHTRDPVLGISLKSLQKQTSGSSHYYLRMPTEAVREEVEDSDPSNWSDGVWKSDGTDAQELFLSWGVRSNVALRVVKTSAEPGMYYVALRRCQSIDRSKCNGSATSPFINNQVCHYYSRKY